MTCGNQKVNSMSKWRIILTRNVIKLGRVKSKRGIFQGHALFTLLLIIDLISLTLKCGYSMSKEKPRINHLLFIDDLRLNGRSE